jgi:hypothetical protein
MPFQDLITQFYQDVDKFTLEKLLETLISMGYVTIDFSSGRKVVVFTETRTNYDS